MIFTKYYTYNIVDSNGVIVGCEVIEIGKWVNPVIVIAAIKTEGRYAQEGIADLKRIK